MLDPVRQVYAAGVGDVGAELHHEIDNREAHNPGGIQHLSSRLDDTLDWSDIDRGTVKYPRARTEVVLHVRNQDGAPVQRDLKWFRLGVEDN